MSGNLFDHGVIVGKAAPAAPVLFGDVDSQEARVAQRLPEGVGALAAFDHSLKIFAPVRRHHFRNALTQGGVVIR